MPQWRQTDRSSDVSQNPNVLSLKTLKAGASTAIGIGVGSGVGEWFGNVSIGTAIGAAIGAIVGGLIYWHNRQRASEPVPKDR